MSWHMSNWAWHTLVRRYSILADLTAHKLDANPWADAIQIQHRHQRGHAEQQVIQKPSVNMYLPASRAQSRSVPANKGQTVENPVLCTVCVKAEATAQLYVNETNMEDCVHTGTYGCREKNYTTYLKISLNIIKPV